MLVVEKFQNNFKVTIQGGLKLVHEWTEEGEGYECGISRRKPDDRGFEPYC